MAVYDYEGAVVSELYDVDGEQIAVAYDVNGAVATGEAYSLDNVVSYYRTPTSQMAETINGLGSDWQSFVFITDPHSADNQQHSQDIALYLLLNTPCKMIVLNGDFCHMEFYTSEYNTYMDKLKPYRNKIYATFGNHEAYSGGDGYATAYERVYLDWIYGKSEIQGTNKGRIYYYVDDTKNKIRYVFINTSDGGNQTVPSTQLSWLESVLQFEDTSWTAVVIGHVNIDDLGGMTTLNCGNGDEVQASIATCNGNLVGYICGHQHIDDTRNVGDFQHTTLMCDMLDSRNSYDGYSLTDRQAGTVSEQAVSVISINTTTKQVVIRRIGAGKQATLSYYY